MKINSSSGEELEFISNCIEFLEATKVPCTVAKICSALTKLLHARHFEVADHFQSKLTKVNGASSELYLTMQILHLSIPQTYTNITISQHLNFTKFHYTLKI